MWIKGPEDTSSYKSLSRGSPAHGPPAESCPFGESLCDPASTNLMHLCKQCRNIREVVGEQYPTARVSPPAPSPLSSPPRAPLDVGMSSAASDISAIVPTTPLPRPDAYGRDQMFVVDCLEWSDTHNQYLAQFAFTMIEKKSWLAHWDLSEPWTSLWVAFSFDSPWPAQEFKFEFPHNWVANEVVSVRHSKTYGRYLFGLSLWNTEEVRQAEAAREERSEGEEEEARDYQ